MPIRKPKQKPIIKRIKKMRSLIEKDKKFEVQKIESRQEIITTLFTTKMEKVGITPSEDSGYIPTSQTPLARYLRRFGVVDDIIDAILAGLAEEESEVAVRDIIEAAADTPEVDLEGDSLKEAQDLAVEEWNKLRRIDSI
ncbi:MAG: hypothetical protein KAR33_13985 [Candidatus Thorarchaeota archaeon]|nr:hypothetical protein [Candidatus Thorarchaeota archaeon]